MEDAYAELYREFLHLRSLCLKQAALLGQLMQALRLQGVHMDVSVPNPVQSTEKEYRCLADGPSVKGDKLLPPTIPGLNATATGGDSNTCHLPEGLTRLKLHTARATDSRETRADLVDGGELFAHQGGNRVSLGGFIHLLQAEQRRATEGMNDLGTIPGQAASAAAQDRKLPVPTQQPWMNSSFLNSEMLSQAGGFLMSEAALHSQVCEFCHAVFPGSSTTMGEFLRHLNTHIT